MADDLHELRDLFSHDTAAWKPIRDEGTIDMQYAAGDPWSDADRRARQKAGRPCINADELSQYTNQTVNEVRSNKRAVKFTPTGNGATDETAQFYSDKMREIEYRSRAQIGYTTAFENAVLRGYGFVRVTARYPHPRAVDQDLYIDPIPNPNLVTPDADWQRPDLSDMRHCWVREPWAYEDYNRKWAKHKIAKYTTDLGKVAGDWLTERRVFVGEKWSIKTTQRELLIVQVPDERDPIGLFESDLPGGTLPPGLQLHSSRKVDDCQVIQQLTNGLEILDETDWPGKFIPIIGCLGKVLYVAETGSERRQVLSMIRLARDPQMAYAYLWTNEVEVVGAMPRFPYFVYEGQLSPKELDNLANSVNEPIAVVQVKPTVEGLPLGNGPLGFPERNPYEPPLQALEFAKEAARRAIQAAMGQTPLPTAAQRRNEKSGVALKHIDELGQKGSFHFTDHYLDMITQVGIVVEDLLDKIYDTPRDVGIRKDDDTAETVRINDANVPDSIRTQGDHLVTVSTGPSFDSEREAANDFAGDLLDSPVLQMLGPQKAPQIIAKAIKLKNLGPIGDQMVAIISPEAAKDGKPTPEQLQQALEQMQGQLQEAQMQLQQAGHIIETKQAEQQGTIRKAEIDAQSRERIAHFQATTDTSREIALQELKNAATITVAHIAASAKGMALDAHAAEEAQALGHEAQQADAQRGHEAGMAERAHQQSLEAGQVEHGQTLTENEQTQAHALEQGDQGQQHALEQGQQAADLAPEPAAGAGA